MYTRTCTRVYIFVMGYMKFNEICCFEPGTNSLFAQPLSHGTDFTNNNPNACTPWTEVLVLSLGLSLI